MNYKDKIEEKIMQYSKELLTIRDTHNVPWLINECTKASNVLAEELTALYEQAQRDAVEGFAKWYDQDVFPEKGYAEQMVGKYLSQTKEDINPKEGE